MVRDIRLQGNTVHRLILNFELRYLRGELQARIVERTGAFRIQIQRAGKVQVSRAKRPKLVETNTCGLDLALVALPLRKIGQRALRRTGRYPQSKPGADFVAGSLKFEIGGLNRFVRNGRLSESNGSLSDGIHRGAVQ